MSKQEVMQKLFAEVTEAGKPADAAVKLTFGAGGFGLIAIGVSVGLGYFGLAYLLTGVLAALVANMLYRIGCLGLAVTRFEAAERALEMLEDK